MSAANPTTTSTPTANGASLILDAHHFASLFPMMSGKPMEKLVASIKADGLQQPIVKFGDVILDGRCRYAACKMVGIDPQYIEYDGEVDGASLAAFITAANIHRRHMEPQQLAMVAAKLLKAAAEMGPRGPIGKLTLEKAAQSVGASTRSTKRATRVLANSTPEIVEAVEKNEVRLIDAEAVASAPANKQCAALEKKREGKAKSLKQAISGGTTFDPAELDAAPASPAPRGANGRPTVSTKQRKDCSDLLGKLCRALSKIGIYDEFVTPLSQIAERLKQL